MRISDWSSDVCSSDLENQCLPHPLPFGESLYRKVGMQRGVAAISKQRDHQHLANAHANAALLIHQEPGQYSQYESDCRDRDAVQQKIGHPLGRNDVDIRSEEHTSELQSIMRISYAVFCLKKKKQKT